jgi:hypothetical protein
MKKEFSQYAQTLIDILKLTPSGTQWVIFTPSFSVASLIQYHSDTSSFKFDILSGAHTHLFNDSIKRFSKRQTDGLIISYEQVLNAPKFEIIKGAIKDIDTLIVDGCYRCDVEKVHYSIELEVFLSHLEGIKPKSVHTIQGSLSSPLIKPHIHELDLPQSIEKWPLDFHRLLESISLKRSIWVAQTWVEANKISATLNHMGVNHALVHKKVEESAKVFMENQFINKELNVCVLTWETILSLEVQDIDCIVFTFEIQSDAFIRFFLPYTSFNAQWKMIEWFKPYPLSHFSCPVNQNMFDFIHHVQMIENGCSMREAERSLNIDSYEFEKILKFLKGRKIIKKEGLNYIIDQPEGILAIKSIEIELINSLSVKTIKINGTPQNFPKDMLFEFSPKKIMPVGWYDFAIIPDDLKHENGVIGINSLSAEAIKTWCVNQNIDTILIGSHHQETIESLKDKFHVVLIKYDQTRFLGGNNPFQKVMRAKSCVESWQIPPLSHANKVALILDHYDEGWNVSAISIALKTHASHLVIVPMCLSF